MGEERLWVLVLLLQLVACQRFPAARQRPHLVNGWGSVRGLPAQSRQLPLTSRQTITLLCQEDRLVVTVLLDLFGIGRPVLSSALSLGPERCPPTSVDQRTAVFQYPLQDCGNLLEMSSAFLIYKSVLFYSPTAGSIITRTNPSTTPISCFYPRYGNVSSNPIKPTWEPFQTTVSSEEKLSFQLQLMKEDWSGPRNAYDYLIGDPMFIQASVDVVNHMPMRILVDNCVAVLSPDVNSNPQYPLISTYGCLVDGKEDPSSTFISPRPQQNILQFVIKAFRFVGYDQSTIYIYCDLRAMPTNLPTDPTSKACSYSQPRNTWSAVEGSSTICSCCDSGNCGSGSSSRGLRPGQRLGIRHHWKREQGAEAARAQEVETLALGPLYIRAPDQNADGSKDLAVHGRSEEQGVKPWMMAAVGGVWVAVVIGALLTWRRCVRKPTVALVQQ